LSLSTFNTLRVQNLQRCYSSPPANSVVPEEGTEPVNETS